MGSCIFLLPHNHWITTSIMFHEYFSKVPSLPNPTARDAPLYTSPEQWQSILANYPLPLTSPTSTCLLELRF